MNWTAFFQYCYKFFIIAIAFLDFKMTFPEESQEDM